MSLSSLSNRLSRLESETPHNQPVNIYIMGIQPEPVEFKGYKVKLDEDEFISRGSDKDECMKEIDEWVESRRDTKEVKLLFVEVN
ncbi:hypothetical protein [Marinobacterium sp. xm-m-312]|uniref:hypothetical protein n=1 Tax=Marinobacterium sp. xm-m-312 TaxID=2497741 RepID=UPI001568E194|nr:hypothetical protein [Marinobacterium sp. xm-m-312]NRQ22731.1 hypothetical protein [Marinobacterium sp. xm-m-312]